MFFFEEHFWVNILHMCRALKWAGIQLSEYFIGIKYHYDEQRPPGDCKGKNSGVLERLLSCEGHRQPFQRTQGLATSTHMEAHRHL